MSQTTSLVPSRPPTSSSGRFSLTLGKASWGRGLVVLGYFEYVVTSKPSFAHSDSANSHPTSPFRLQSFMRRLSGLQTRSHDTRLYSHSRTTKNSGIKVRHHSSWSAPCASTWIKQYTQHSFVSKRGNGINEKCAITVELSVRPPPKMRRFNGSLTKIKPQLSLSRRGDETPTFWKRTYCLVMMRVFPCCF